MQTWLNQQPAWLIAIALTLLMIVALRLGRKMAALYAAKHGDIPDNSKTLISAILALTAFLLGFAFSLSSNRYDLRRQSIVEEANAIGTAILRADLYPDSIRGQLRGDFKTYLDQRISFHTVGPQYDSAVYWEKMANESAGRLWETATRYARNSKDIITAGQMLPALNAMFDSATTRHYALIAKVPEPVLYTLFILAIVSAFFAGYSGPKELVNNFVSSVFCLLTVLVIILILDLDRPRRGMIQFDDTHQAVESLRQQFEK